MEHSQGEILKDEGGGDISMEEIEFMNVSVKIWVQVWNYFERYGKIHTWQARKMKIMAELRMELFTGQKWRCVVQCGLGWRFGVGVTFERCIGLSVDVMIELGDMNKNGSIRIR